METSVFNFVLSMSRSVESGRREGRLRIDMSDMKWHLKAFVHTAGTKRVGRKQLTKVLNADKLLLKFRACPRRRTRG